MVINDRYGFVFIHVPKAAGTSLAKALMRLDGNNTKLLASTKHETLIDFQKNWWSRADSVETKNPEAYFRFAFVRNPWIRMHSLYCYLKECRPRMEIDSISSFSEFLLQFRHQDSWVNSLHSTRPQLDYFISKQGALEMNFVGHYEFLHDDINTLKDSLGLALQIQQYNSSSSSSVDYRTLYDPSMIENVADRFKSEIELFGYEFEKAVPNCRCSGALKNSASNLKTIKS